MTDHVVDSRVGQLEPEALDLAARIFDWARSGDTASLAAYLDAGVSVNLTNANEDTLVMLAAYYGHESAVAVLVEHGADVNRHNKRGQTPLAAAVFKNEEAITDLLLRAGVDPLAGARFFGRNEAAQHLQQHIEGRAHRYNANPVLQQCII
jgi:uncharacterized protein